MVLNCFHRYLFSTRFTFKPFCGTIIKITKMKGMVFLYSVTRRIKMIKQPRGGYINRKQLNVETLDDGKTLNEVEDVHPVLVGLAVDYLTRFMMGTPAEEAFKISLQGARCYDLAWEWIAKVNGETQENGGAQEYAAYLLKILNDLKGLDDQSITIACRLAGYDVCYRAGIGGYSPVQLISPDKATIENIAIMVNRCLSFWEKYGPLVKDGFTFEGGYTDTVSSGDGDYLTKDTLWDFKVSKEGPKPQHTLQLLMYYIMGCHSIHPEFKSINKLGIFNPRLNTIYTININSISPEIIKEIENDVICY